MKNFFILIISLLSISFIKAQDNKTLPEKEFSLIIGPSFTNIKNDNIEFDKYASPKGTIWFNAGINYCKCFNKNLGFITGLEYSMYKNVTTYKGAFRSEEKSVDSDGYLYYAVSEANYKDTRTVHCAEVPLGLRLQVPGNDNFQFFVDLGLRLNFIATAKIEKTGTLDKKGAYPHNVYDNVYIYIERDPYYGFTNTTYSSKIDIPVNRLGLGYFVGGGLKAKLAENKYIVINPTYISGITDFVNKSNQSDYVNVFGEKSAYKKFTLTQFALRIGIVFAL
ncbi:MAG: outer membrane beta-barrel protein [Bacteroidia bacterium]|nr:outer membrane beta-barrel protein [Bacteroidia bacterium]